MTDHMTPTMIFYRKRKEIGLCLRCSDPGYLKPNGIRSPLCYKHFREKQSLKPYEVQSSDVLDSEAQAPREKHQAEYLKHLPELPSNCPRCQAMLLDDWLEVEMAYNPAKRCPNCAWYCDQFMYANKLYGAS